MAFFDEIKSRITGAAQTVSSKTRDGVELTRISAEERSVGAQIAALYEQIGRGYVDDEEKTALDELRQRVMALRARLDELAGQKALLRNQNRCPACGATVEKSARYCPSCGRRMPEEARAASSADAELSYCPVCGAMHKKDERFCAVCGHAYESPAPAAETDAPAPEVNIDNEAPSDFNAD